jgi:hypothetical protein
VTRHLDVTGREIRSGDLLRRPHFVGRRRKQHYQYFVVFGFRGTMRAAHPHLIPQGSLLEASVPLALVKDATIIAGYACRGDEVSFEDRPREARP